VAKVCHKFLISFAISCCIEYNSTCEGIELSSLIEGAVVVLFVL